MEAAHGTRPLYLQCDITDTAALKAAIGKAAEAHADLTVLVNNAANDKRHATLDVDEAFWDWSQAINLKPYFFAAQTVIRGMQAAGGGAIVNMSSISYMMGNAGYPAYTTANGGITAMTRSLAREFGGDNIRVNALAPGWVFTDKQLEMWATEEGVKAHMERQCLKRMLKPEEMVAPVLFLASAASGSITGQAIAADGGVVVSG